MNKDEFNAIPDGRYSFEMYYGDTLYGVPYISMENKCYVIPINKINEYNKSLILSDEYKEKTGIIIPINPEAIEEYSIFNFKI